MAARSEDNCGTGSSGRSFPTGEHPRFGVEEAALSAKIYRSVSWPRGREIDLAIAACAIVRDAELWTLNPTDFKDIPGLRLYGYP